MAFIGSLLAFTLVHPSSADAQSGQVQEVVRASAFILVGTDGTTLARLGQSPVGNSNLELYDATGARRVLLAAAGAMNIYDPDGNLVFRAGVVPSAPPDLPAVNGVMLGPGGSISVLPHQP